MKISELKNGQGQVEVEAEVTDKSEVREFQKFGRSLRVATITIKDKSGNIKMSLWNEDIDKVNVGDKIKVSNGYVKDFQGEPQLTTGKFGKLEVVEKGKGTAKKEAEEEPEEAEEAPEEESEELGEEQEAKDEVEVEDVDEAPLE